MARKMFGRFFTVRTLIRVAYAAISLNAIPYANGAETVPHHCGHSYTIMAAGMAYTNPGKA